MCVDDLLKLMVNQWGLTFGTHLEVGNELAINVDFFQHLDIVFWAQAKGS